METNGRFIKNVTDATQIRAQLGRQTYPLRLTTGERIRASIERQIGNPTSCKKDNRGMISLRIGAPIIASRGDKGNEVINW